MKLKEIMDLKVGEWFFHRGKPARVVWTEFSTQLVYLKDPTTSSMSLVYVSN